MSFCMLNLMKGGDLAKNEFWHAKIQNGRQLVRHLGFGTSKNYFLSCHHLKLDKSCNKLCMYQISQTYHQNSHPSFNIDNFRFCPQSSSTDCVVNNCTKNQQLIFLKQDGHVMDRRSVCILLYKIIFDN